MARRSAPPDVHVGRQAVAAPEETPDVSPGTPAASSGTAPTEPDAAAEPGAAEVDRLFRRLYPRVRDELRWELLVQRERAGLLADPR